MRVRRLILPEPVGQLELADAAGARGWRPGGVRDSQEAWERTWITPDERTFITYVDDRILGIRYVAVHGDNDADVTEQLRSALPVVTREELREVMGTATGRDQKVGTAYYVAVFSYEYEDELFEYLAKLMEDPDSEVRRAAVFASSYASWRELQPVLERVRSHDSDPTVRQLAQATLDNIEKHVWSKES